MARAVSPGRIRQSHMLFVTISRDPSVRVNTGAFGGIVRILLDFKASFRQSPFPLRETPETKLLVHFRSPIVRVILLRQEFCGLAKRELEQGLPSCCISVNGKGRRPWRKSLANKRKRLRVESPCSHSASRPRCSRKQFGRASWPSRSAHQNRTVASPVIPVQPHRE